MASTPHKASTADAASPAPEGVLERAVHLLRLVVDDAPIGIRALARKSGLPTSTVGRLAQQLVDLGLLRRVGDGIAPGPTLAELGSGAAPISLSQRLRPLLVELVASTGESAAIAVDGGEAVLYLDHIESDSAVRVASVAERRHPFHVVAPGLALMAEWPLARLRAMLRAEPLSAPTAHSVVEPSQVLDRLASIRASRIAWALEELDLEVNGIATTITLGNEDGSVATVAVSLYGPSYRLSPAASPTIETTLLDTVDEFVRRLR